MNRIVTCLLGALIMLSCRNDDNVLPGISIPQRSLSEVALEDDAELKEYLQTHFYNYEEFENPPANFDFKIRFDTIAGDNAGKTSIFDSSNLKSQIIKEESAIFGLDDGEEVNHTLYYLEARLGLGGSPTVGDNTVLRYEGSLLDGRSFDASTVPLNQYLSGGLIRGYSAGVEKFSAGMGPEENGDGTVTFTDYGVGAIFIPSGLGYFSSSPPNSIIPAYAPLIFKIDLLAFEEDTDFDGDGIPSILEDLDGDENLNNDNTDSDSEPATVFLANHNDADDDGDGIPTIEEIELDADGNFVGFKDTDGDTIPDHLDSDS
ncbi:FKBP-type peptidyl-prolyl cis-trans isomerase [Maribacter sp. 2308TA10-17]|uniref:FKBP-type peptidyl-prolyl cis-trans isomerase n=1 Tax=Maribacter sp. 2308TA10-17 TaxID=3386276 RepID=UPI0039BC353D